jgi:hypothetical protein
MLCLCMQACTSAVHKNMLEPTSVISEITPSQNTKQLQLIEGKFKFKTYHNSVMSQGSGLFTWQQHASSSMGWVLKLQTPIYTNIATIIYNLDIEKFDIDLYKPIYKWENLPFIQHGMQLSAHTFEQIMYNIHKPDILKRVIEQEGWVLSTYEQKTDTLHISLKQNNINELTLIILN